MAEENEGSGLTIENLQIEISTTSTAAANGVIAITNQLQSLKTVLKGGIKGLTTVTRQINALNTAINAMNNISNLRELRDVLAQIKGIGDVGITAQVTDIANNGNYDNLVANAVPITSQVESGNGSMQYDVASLKSGNDALQAAVASTTELTRVTEQATGAEKELKKALNEPSKGQQALESICAATENATKGMGNFWKSLKRIALYRAIRTILKGITDALREGIGNIAQYSEEANYTLSQLSTSFLQLKNSIGAAVMPLLEMLAPLILELTNAIIYMVNGLNQAIALMTGKGTYTKAIAYWQDYADGVNKAKKALTGFDELNVLGDNKVDYSSMFEETEVEIGSMVGGLTGLIASLTTIVGLTALLKTASFAGAIGGLKGMAGVLLTIVGLVGGITSGFEMWNNGVTWEGTLTYLGSMLALVGGLELLFGTVGVAVGAVIAAIGSLAIGIKDMVENGLSIENVTLVVGGLGFALVALGAILMKANLAFGSTFMIIGLIVAVVAGVIASFDGMSDTMKTVTIAISAAVAILAGLALAALAANGALTFGVGAALAAAAIGGAVVMLAGIMKSSGIESGGGSARTYADGGFPEAGQLFIANEAGPELVGTMRGKTTVANNNQIIEGVRQAVAAGMQDAGSNGGDWTINIIDKDTGRVTSSQIITAAQRRNQRDGKTVIQLGV